MRVTVDPELTSIVQAGVLVMDDVVNAGTAAGFDGALETAAQALRGSTGLEAALAAVRTMYKRVGIDPTKTRPSSEALLRRIRKGEPLPRVNTVVDICNWCSVEMQLPYGVYDRNRIEGDVVLRLGRAGEEYPGIRKDTVHLAGRLAVVDVQGPFGNPTSDSARTMVTPSTTRVLVVIFGPRQIGPAQVERALETTSRRLADYAGAREAARLLP